MSRDRLPVEVDGVKYSYGEFVNSPFVFRCWRFGITSQPGVKRVKAGGRITCTIEGWRCLFWRFWWKLLF